MDLLRGADVQHFIFHFVLSLSWVNVSDLSADGFVKYTHADFGL